MRVMNTERTCTVCRRIFLPKNKYRPSKTCSSTCGHQATGKGNPTRWTEEERQVVRENYRKGAPFVQSLLPHRTIKTIQAIAGRLGVQRKWGIEYGWSEEVDRILIENADKGGDALKKLLPGFSLPAIHGRAANLGISIGSPQDFKNHHAFDRLDQTSAYWLGFIAADGCVSDSGEVSIGISANDIHHLFKFRDWIDPQRKVYTRIVRKPNERFKKQVYYNACIQFKSRPIAQRLAEFGITPKKSQSLKFPKIPEKFFASFIRGYSDGDGYFTVGLGKSVSLRWGLLGTLEFLEACAERLRKRIPGVSISFHKKDGIHELITTKNVSAIQVGVLLYEHGGIHLERKKAVWDCFPKVD